MAIEIQQEENQEEIVDLHPDIIPVQNYNDIITQNNVLNSPIIIKSIMRGATITAGSGNSCFKFDQQYGLWLGNTSYSSAPFKVSMAGALIASSVTITGLDADDITETASKKWAGETGADITSAHTAASIASQGALATLDAVAAAQIASNAVEEAKIAADAVTATKIAVSGLDGATGNVAANHIIAGMLQTDCVISVKIQADAVTAAKINVVGLDGTSGRIIVADQTDADVITGGINSHAVTLIGAGKILISGSTTLDEWGHATDVTKIDGGEIYTGSVTATQITVTNLAAINADLGSITAGNITLDSSGYIKGGQTAYRTGYGHWMGYETDTYKFSMKGTSGDELYFDGVNVYHNDSRLLGYPIFGDGSDGDVDINSGTFSSSPITSNALTRDASFDDLTLSGGDLDCAGYRLFVKGTLTIGASYKVYRNGNTGANASGYTAGAGGTALANNNLFGSIVGGAGATGKNNGAGNGTAGSNGANADRSIAVDGAAGGDSNDGEPYTGAAGGTGGTATASTMRPYSYPFCVLLYEVKDNVSPRLLESSASGGGGAGGYSAGFAPAAGGGGGGAGSGGGIVLVVAKKIVNNGSIESTGGDGGDGGAAAHTGGGGGGGAGGSGGTIILIYNAYSGAGTKPVTGGTGGDGGAGAAVGPAGDSGTNGNAGVLIELQN